MTWRFNLGLRGLNAYHGYPDPAYCQTVLTSNGSAHGKGGWGDLLHLWLPFHKRWNLEAQKEDHVPGALLSIGGSEGRPEATGRGVMYQILSAFKTLGMGVDDVSVAVQCFGKVGASVAKLLHDQGCRIIAVSDVSGGVYNGRGLDPEGDRDVTCPRTVYGGSACSASCSDWRSPVARRRPSTPFGAVTPSP